MPKVTKYTQEEVEEMVSITTLLARSDQWGDYIGCSRETKKIDEMLNQGDLVAAKMHLSWIVRGRLPRHLVKVAVRARKDYLDSLGNEPKS